MLTEHDRGDTSRNLAGMVAPTRNPLAGLTQGSLVLIRDEEWLVRSISDTPADGKMLKVVGVSELVRDQEATFFTSLDKVEALRPEDTQFVADLSPNYRRSRLFIEALIRRTPLPAGEARLAVGHRQLLDPLTFQHEAVNKALSALRPRILIADAVGLGKTLEVGMLLSELIRRGRGDRILVVTPKHILEQFQHELWTRFAIPLIRLDSVGIDRIRQKLPASRNPFTYYRRVIISLDTLKNPSKYRDKLRDIHWDAAVIDESHGLINKGTLNNELANILAPRTDALILTSATPHNGDARSFANLIDLLDPTAIADKTNYTRQDIDHLYIRRFKKDVAHEVGDNFPDRKEPIPIDCPASPAEDAVFTELDEVWINPPNGESPVTGQARHLFPMTLLKAFLSSHEAFLETVKNRRKTLASNGPLTAEQQREDDALVRLATLAEEITDDDSAKLTALLRELGTIGVGPNSTQRVVIFSERVATLHWLATAITERLKLKTDAVKILHGGLSDVLQQQIVEEFAIEDTPLRVLIAGDLASEGVNLHRQCHHLIHFDLPWSLITIEQRNGRIDRYGQERPPEVRALLLVPTTGVKSDLTVLKSLLDKEHQAHLSLGEAAPVMGKFSATDEEKEIREIIRGAKSVDTINPDTPAYGFDFDPFAPIDGPLPSDLLTEPIALFPNTLDLVRTALYEIYDNDPAGKVDLREEDSESLISIEPPEDLIRRLAVLPQTYLNEQKILERLRLTDSEAVAGKSLEDARQGITRGKGDAKSLWPHLGYLSEQHPMVDWLFDKLLAGFGRNTAPIIAGDVHEPTFFILGMYTNGFNQPTVVEWMAVSDLSFQRPTVHRMDEVLTRLNLGPDTVNPGVTSTSAGDELLAEALSHARTHMEEIKEDRRQELIDRVRAHDRRLSRWRSGIQSSIDMDNPTPHDHRRMKRVEEVTAHQQDLISKLSSVGDPLLRVVAVVVPE